MMIHGLGCQVATELVNLEYTVKRASQVSPMCPVHVALHSDGMIAAQKNSGCLVEKVLITTATFQVGENDRFSDFL